MHHVFASTSMLSDHGKTLLITGSDFHHIVRVLRMKEGDELSVSLTDDAENNSGRIQTGERETAARTEYRFGIEEISGDKLICRLRFVKRDTAELPVRLILLQGLPKADKMEQVIEKNTELGITEIVPVSLKRCVMKLDEKKALSRVARWNKIAESAAKQSGRGIIPKVTEVMTLARALAYVNDADLKLIPYELVPPEEAAFPALPANASPGREGVGEGGMKRTRSLIEGVKPGQTAAVCIGPEGGFEETEVAAAREAGFFPVTLGGRILRTETAGMAVTAWFAYRFFS